MNDSELISLLFAGGAVAIVVALVQFLLGFKQGAIDALKEERDGLRRQRRQLSASPPEPSKPSKRSKLEMMEHDVLAARPRSAWNHLPECLGCLRQEAHEQNLLTFKEGLEFNKAVDETVRANSHLFW